jgi:hypothetical protein
MTAMKAVSSRVVVLACALACAAAACGHKKPKEAKSSSAPAAVEKQRCEVKGFNYNVPEPGPIVDAREAGAP